MQTATLNEIDTEFEQENGSGLIHFNAESKLKSAAENLIHFDVRVGNEQGVPVRKPRVARSDEERARAQAARDKAREAREERRRQRQAERANAPAKHSIKLQRAAEGLPVLSERVNAVFQDLTSNYDDIDIMRLTAHLQFHIRYNKTTASRSLSKLEEGQAVKIVSTSVDTLRFLGKEGVVARSQSIHIMVDVEGTEVYLYRSDVEPIA